MKKVAVLLAGCGYLDGSAIHEVTLTLLALAQHNIAYEGVAPDRPQHHVVNHLTMDEQAEGARNILEESARVLRGKVKAISAVSAADYDAVIVPGGFGAAKNLFDLALAGEHYQLQEDVKHFLTGFVSAQKPMGFICISPMIIPLIFPKGTVMTIGSDEGCAGIAAAKGANPQPCAVTDVVIDETHRIVSTPAYMYGEACIAEVSAGIHQLVKQIAHWVK